jgi:hypothetical protein
MDEKIKPEVYKCLNPSNINQSLDQFCKELVKIEQTYSSESKQVAQINEVTDEVEAINRGNNKNSNRGPNRNNSSNPNSNSNAGNNGYKNYSKNKNNFKYNRGNKRKQITYCWNCKAWGYHVARECKKDTRTVREIQFADVKPGIEEVNDPDWSSRKDEYTSNKMMSAAELDNAMEARKTYDFPMKVYGDNLQSFGQSNKGFY